MNLPRNQPELDGLCEFFLNLFSLKYVESQPELAGIQLIFLVCDFFIGLFGGRVVVERRVVVGRRVVVERRVVGRRVVVVRRRVVEGRRVVLGLLVAGFDTWTKLLSSTHSYSS